MVATCAVSNAASGRLFRWPLILTKRRLLCLGDNLPSVQPVDGLGDASPTDACRATRPASLAIVVAIKTLRHTYGDTYGDTL